MNVIQQSSTPPEQHGPLAPQNVYTAQPQRSISPLQRSLSPSPPLSPSKDPFPSCRSSPLPHLCHQSNNEDCHTRGPSPQYAGACGRHTSAPNLAGAEGPSAAVYNLLDCYPFNIDTSCSLQTDIKGDGGSQLQSKKSPQEENLLNPQEKIENLLNPQEKVENLLNLMDVVSRTASPDALESQNSNTKNEEQR